MSDLLHHTWGQQSRLRGPAGGLITEPPRKNAVSMNSKQECELPPPLETILKLSFLQDKNIAQYRTATSSHFFLNYCRRLEFTSTLCAQCMYICTLACMQVCGGQRTTSDAVLRRFFTSFDRLSHWPGDHSCSWPGVIFSCPVLRSQVCVPCLPSYVGSEG